MTIVEAINYVLKNSNTGMTSIEIYKQIVKENLYSFGAKNPVSVVNNQIRRRCVGLDFPTAYPQKLFEIIGYKGKKPLFIIKSINDREEHDNNIGYKEVDMLPEEKVSLAIKEHIESIRVQVFERILNNSPSFFEHLVMELLLKI